MAVKYSVEVRNSKLAAIEATIGTGATLEVFTGAAPVNTSAADSGIVLATVLLPDDFFDSPVNGSMAKLGTWSDASADATGVAGHFRIKDSEGTVHMQGSITTAGGSGDLIVDNVNFSSGQSFTIQTFTITAGNA